MIIFVIAFVVLWLACGAVSAAYTYNYFQLSFPSRAKQDEALDFKHALWTVVFGPIALYVDWKMGLFSKGFTLRRYKYED